MANKTRLPYTLANAFTNNTFSLEQAHSELHRSVNNSFQYLESVQKSYVDIHRYTFHNEDFIINKYGIRSFNIPRDIIEPTKRRAYKNSALYDKDITFKQMQSNAKYFKYIPMILVDDTCFFDFTIHTYIDEKFELLFPTLEDIDFFSEEHTYKIILMRPPVYTEFTTNKNVVTKYNYKLPTKITGITSYDSNTIAFFAVVGDGNETLHSEIREAKFNSKHELVLDPTDAVLMNYLNRHRNFTFIVMKPLNIHKFRFNMTVGEDQLTSKTTLLAAIDAGANDGVPYQMPIPTESILVVKRNISTFHTILENGLDVTLHYPNIYSIDAEDLVEAGEEDNTFFDVFYFYVPSVQKLKFTDRLHYLYKYFMEKYDLGYQETIAALTYDDDIEPSIRDFYAYMRDYQDVNFIYSNNDFIASSLYPYDYDYKIAKMKEFINKDNDVLKNYAESFNQQYENFYLDVSTVGLSTRYRTNTKTEAKDPANWKTFSQPCYVFSFRNEAISMLQVRFFVDGLLIREAWRFNEKGMEYIYFYTTDIKEDSFIEMEVFRKYLSVTKLTFANTTELLDVTFQKNEFIEPKLYDLMVCDANYNKLPVSKVKIYAQVDPTDYDKLDKKGAEIKNKSYIIEEDGVYYVDTTPTYYEQDPPTSVNDNTKASVKFMPLGKLKVKLLDSSYVGQDLYLAVNKVAGLYIDTMIATGVPKIKVFGAGAVWDADSSFIRTFINGRLTVIPYKISEEEDGIYIIPRAYIDEGEKITIDVTPYSYELEYYLERVNTSDFIIDFGTELTKPFSLKYYDAYLNGRKLSANNIQILSPSKIRLVNTHSDFRFKLFRKDRDYEYFSLNNITKVPVDDFLDSNEITEEDKKNLIETIIKENFDHYTDPDTTEGDAEDKYEMTEEEIQMHEFYLEVIIPEGICRPEDFYISKDLLTTKYPYVKENYASDKRIVIRPNIHADVAKVVLIVGKNNSSEVGKVEHVKAIIAAGQEAALGALGFTNIIDAIVAFYERIDYTHILIDPEDRHLYFVQDDVNNDEN